MAETAGHDAGYNASHTDDKAVHPNGETVFTDHQAKAADVVIEAVKAAPFADVIKTSGRIAGTQDGEQTVVATAAGVLNFAGEVTAEGVQIRQGESIATVSATTLQDGDATTKARLEMETAEKEYQRASRLVSQKIISGKDFEQARLRYETARAAYEGMSRNVTPSGVAVPSPISGHVKQLLAAQGSYVSVGQPIAVVAQSRRLRLVAEVAESDYGRLREVTSANFKTSYSDCVHKLSDLGGKLLSYGKSTTPNSFYIPVTFEFNNIGDILPGAFTDVWLIGRTRPNVITVPQSALIEEQGLYFVYVNTSREHYRKQEVRLGGNDGKRVEITAGLSAGDKVVTQGAYQVKLASASATIPHGHSH